MKSSTNQFSHASVRLLAAAALCAIVAFAPALAFAASSTTHENRIEMRINGIHAKLKITTAQEDQWGKVAQVMRDNAKAVDTLVQERKAHAAEMTAVDDLKSFGAIADAHAYGIKQLTSAFSDLYANMSDAQKKDADILFRHGERMHAHMRHKMHANKPASTTPEVK